MPLLWAPAGLDSITSIELQGALTKRFACDIPATIAFDYPTPRLIASHLSVLDGTNKTQGPPSHDHLVLASPSRSGITMLVSAACDVPSVGNTGATSKHAVLCGAANAFSEAVNNWILLDAGLHKFWTTHSAGFDVISTVPMSRWDVEACYDPSPALGKSYSRFGSFVEVGENAQLPIPCWPCPRLTAPL